MGLEGGGHCWLRGRPLERADRVRRVPNWVSSSTLPAITLTLNWPMTTRQTVVSI